MERLGGGVASRGVLLLCKGRLSVNSRGGDDAIIIFGINRLGVFGGGIQYN